MIRSTNNGHVQVLRGTAGNAFVTVVKYSIKGATAPHEFKIVADYETASKGAMKSARKEAAKHGIIL